MTNTIDLNIYIHKHFTIVFNITDFLFLIIFLLHHALGLADGFYLLSRQDEIIFPFF